MTGTDLIVRAVEWPPEGEDLRVSGHPAGHHDLVTQLDVTSYHVIITCSPSDTAITSGVRDLHTGRSAEQRVGVLISRGQSE